MKTYPPLTSPSSPGTDPLDDAVGGRNPRGGFGAARLTMTVSEAAAVLGISRALAYELVARGELPSIRLGHRIVVPTKRLHDLVLGGNVTADPAPTWH